MTRKLLIIFSILLQVNYLIAQEPADALRYAMTGNGGTARARAIGGAVVSLGGDISAATLNPAGLGLFKTNEFVFSPGLSFGKTKIDYLDKQNQKNNFNLDFTNIGVIFAKPGSRNERWRNFTFGIGMNKSVNFSNSTKLSGTNKQSSYSEKYLEELINNNVTDPNNAAKDFPYGASLAFNTFLIDTISGPGNVINGYRSLSTPQTGVLQEQMKTTKGGMREMYVAASANFEDKIYLGGSLVFSKLSYERTTIFRESDITSNKLNHFNYFETEDYLLSDGVGVGLKLGAIFKPTQQLRVGVAFHTPMVYNMDDRYSSKITTDMEGYMGNGILSQSSLDFNSNELGQFQYNYVNPMRMMFGLSYVFIQGEDVKQQRGFISADVEYINYSSAKFKTSSLSGSGTDNGSTYLKQVTEAIKNQFKSGLNFRVGGELKFNTIMTRLGFNYMGNPYASYGMKGKQMNLSGGLGYRNKGYFIDFTYVHQMISDMSFPYKLDNGVVNPGYEKGSMGNIIATVGFKF